MSKRAIELFIFDIFIAILKIEHTASKFNNSQDLLYNYTDWDSVIREFEIIGEASKHLIDASILGKEHRVIVDFRNIIIHEYFGIEPQEVWNIINNNLTNFKNLIIQIINSFDKKLKEELIYAYIEDNKYLNFVVEELKALR